MSGPLWRRTLCWIVIVLGGGAAEAQMPAAPQVAWLHLTPECSPASPDITTTDGEEPQVVACGGAGFFAFGKSGLHYHGNCRTLPEEGSETPSAIPVELTPRLPPAFPCAQGRCLGHSSGRPWVAMLDWATEHGWSVAATLREASDQRVDVQLYDLEAAGAVSQWVPSVSDLHVLVQLCALEETVQANPLDRPLAVNLSFGRLSTGDDCAQPKPGLGCAVSQVLSHLASEGVLPVAAAGNHHEMLFPAASPDVVSAGALDLSSYRQNEEPRPSTQTPPTAAALMLGYGLYLSTDDKDSYWPAPPGSSYAAALLTGWLGGTLAGGGQLPDLPLLKGSRWAPVFTASANGLALGLNGVPLAGSELTGPRLLLDRAVGATAPSPAPPVDATLQLTGPAPPMPELPMLYADAGNDPQPGVCPCVPCGGGGQGGLGSKGGPSEDPEAVLLDLSASVGLPPQISLLRVFLRVGKAIYAFDSSGDPDLLARIAAGKVAGLAFSGISNILQSGEQPSLTLVVNVGGLAYWHEVPIDLSMPR